MAVHLSRSSFQDRIANGGTHFRTDLRQSHCFWPAGAQILERFELAKPVPQPLLLTENDLNSGREKPRTGRHSGLFVRNPTKKSPGRRGVGNSKRNKNGDHKEGCWEAKAMWVLRRLWLHGVRDLQTTPSLTFEGRHAVGLESWRSDWMLLCVHAFQSFFSLRLGKFAARRPPKRARQK